MVGQPTLLFQRSKLLRVVPLIASCLFIAVVTPAVSSKLTLISIVVQRRRLRRLC